MTGPSEYSGTIPRLLARAAERDPGGIWLRTDESTLTFGQAAARVAGLARALREAGIRRGDLVLVTARSTPGYLLCWLALPTLGAVTVSVNPRSAPAEIAGMARQVAPRVMISDAGLAPLADAAVRERPGLVLLDCDELAARAPAGNAAELAGTGVGPDDLAVLLSLIHI